MSVAKPKSQVVELKVADVRLGWGNPTVLKARWRQDSLREHLERPVAERLLKAFSMLQKRKVP